MKVRRARPGDEELWARTVSAIVPAEDRDGSLASAAQLADALADSRCYLFLAFEEDSAIGLLSAYRFPDVEAGGSLVYLYDIEVAAAHRQKGAGRALVQALVKSCSADGVKRIWAGTETENAPARRTFETTDAELEGESYAEYEWELEY